jgi:polyisoprenoid-binding protein YceI
VRKKLSLGAGIVLAAILAAVGGSYVYVNLIEGPPEARLTIPDADPADAGATAGSSASGSSTGTDGIWSVADGSKVGYRVREVLFGQDNEAVGRTSEVTGSIKVTGTTIEDGSFTADLTSVSSDQERRDRQFHGRIMNTATYPTATFTLTEPIRVDAIPEEGVERTVEAMGKLSLAASPRA